ncbi:unnamed protein product [Polarella glacialis]|uniref:HopJ type III effector protein n=1 Tax=Polarella glacialis TaxID=89957 RepID=A0A813DYZ3_POLGL|nr:unnamed protein product [Polarella glacialis]
MTAASTLTGVHALRSRLSAGQELAFAETLAAIAADFEYTPKQFVNGGVESAAGSNEGSCEVFSLGKLAGFSEAEVLACFGEHYQQVLGDPAGTSHGNIRAFMKHGWAVVDFPDSVALEPSGALAGIKALRARFSAGQSELAFAETLAAIAADFETLLTLSDRSVT